MFTSYVDTPAASEFERVRIRYAQQEYIMPNDDINHLLTNNDEAKQLGRPQLSKAEAWQGLKWKAEKPENYIPVKESVIVPDSRKPTEYGETFTRLTVQPSFATGELVLVKEDIHIYEKEKKIFFLGREVDLVEAKKYLKQANENMLIEKPALFNVEHAVAGSDEMPIATWRMVRLSDVDPNEENEAKRILRIRNLVESDKGATIYLQTIRQLNSEAVARVNVISNKKTD